MQHLESFLGKLITIKINDRDESGKIIPDKFTIIKGKSNFVGYNNILNHNQITINRMPIFPFDESQIIKVE
jgi:hypothetical protein